MHNTTAEGLLNTCTNDLARIDNYIASIGSTSPASNFLTKYALMHICGTLERAYKIIITDYYKRFSHELERFIDKNVSDASLNATYDNICKVLKLFNESKSTDFKSRVHNLPNHERILLSFTSLNNLRNDLVHGRSMNASFLEIKKLYQDVSVIIIELDNVLQ